MLTLPNLLTLSRIVAVPLLVAFLWWPRWEAGFGIAFALYCLMGITDYFDGYLARAQGAVSKLGVFLDPIADKIMVAAVILMLVGTRHEDPALISGVHLIAALVILLREIAVSGLREFLAGLQVSLPVSRLAKWKTPAQMIAIAPMFLGTGVDYYEKGLPPLVGEGRVWRGDWSDLATHLGLVLMWFAAILTAITGWDYFQKARPWLRDVR